MSKASHRGGDHLERATCQSELERKQRRLTCPVEQVVDRCDDDVSGVVVLHVHDGFWQRRKASRLHQIDFIALVAVHIPRDVEQRVARVMPYGNAQRGERPEGTP